MSTKRRQSTSGGVRKKPGPGQNPKFKYELVRYSQQGDLTSLSEEELAEFKRANAGFVAKWLTDAGAEDATWDSQCRHVLDTIMARPAAPRRLDPRARPPTPPTPLLCRFPQKLKSAAWFLKPVDPVALQLADYFKVIKEPMDLGTVRTRLAGGFYQGAEEMADAVHLTFSNAMMYNPKGSVAHEDAKKCLTVFEKKWEAVARKVRPPVAMPTPGHAATPRRPPTLPCTRLRARPLPPHLRASAPPHPPLAATHRRRGRRWPPPCHPPPPRLLPRLRRRPIPHPHSHPHSHPSPPPRPHTHPHAHPRAQIAGGQPPADGAEAPSPAAYAPPPPPPPPPPAALPPAEPPGTSPLYS